MGAVDGMGLGGPDSHIPWNGSQPATPSAGAPQPVVMGVASALGPRWQMACLNTEGMEANAKGLPGALTIGKQTFCFCGVHSGQHTLRTELVKSLCSQLGVKRSLCLTKVKGPFQSTQGSGRGPKLTLPEPVDFRAAPASRLSVGSFCSSTEGQSVGSQALEGAGVQLPGPGVIPGTRRQDC